MKKKIGGETLERKQATLCANCWQSESALMISNYKFT